MECHREGPSEVDPPYLLRSFHGGEPSNPEWCPLGTPRRVDENGGDEWTPSGSHGGAGRPLIGYERGLHRPSGGPPAGAAAFQDR